MSDFDSPEFASRSRFALLKRHLSARKLKTILTKPSANRGLERYRRAGITASSSFIAKALNILISFLSVPLTVHYLGAERYGVWLTISSLLTWMSMTDFGLAGNALVNVLAEASGREDRAAAQHYTASAFWALTGVSALAGVISVASFRYIPWRAVFRVSASTSTHELQWACGLTLVFFVLAFPLSIQNSIYSAYQDGFLANAWGIGANIFSLAALIVVSQTHGGLPQLVLALSGTRALVSIANCFFLFRRYHWLTPTPSAVRWQCVKRLFSLGSKYLVTQLASHKLDKGNDHFDPSTLAFTTVDVGNAATNVIPGEARAAQGGYLCSGLQDNRFANGLGLHGHPTLCLCFRGSQSTQRLALD